MSRLRRRAKRRGGAIGASAGALVVATLADRRLHPAGAGLEPQSFAFAIGNGKLAGTPPRSATATRSSTWSSSTARRRRRPRSPRAPGRRRRRPRLPERRHDREVARLVPAGEARTASRPGRTGRTSGSPTSRRPELPRQAARRSRRRDPREGLRRALPRQRRHGRAAQAQALSVRAWASSSRRLDALAQDHGGCCSPRTGARGAGWIPRPGRRPPDRPPRRLEPRGRHLDLRLRPPPVRAELERQIARRRSTSWSEMRRAGPVHDRHRTTRRAPTGSAAEESSGPTPVGVGALPYVANIGLTREAVDAGPAADLLMRRVPRSGGRITRHIQRRAGRPAQPAGAPACARDRRRLPRTPAAARTRWPS